MTRPVSRGAPTRTLFLRPQSLPSPPRHAPAPTDLLHTTASYAVFATPAPGGAGGGGPSMRHSRAAPPCPSSAWCQQPRPPPRPAPQAPPPSLPCSLHTRVEAPRAHTRTYTLSITHTQCTHTPHAFKGSPLPAPSLLSVLVGTVNPEKTPSKGSPSPRSGGLLALDGPTLILQGPQRGLPKVTQQLDDRADPMVQNTVSQADAPPQGLPASRPEMPTEPGTQENTAWPPPG